MVDEISGELLRYNSVKGKMPGIQVDTEEGPVWFNATEKTKKFVEALKDKIGSTVRMQVEDCKINFVGVIDSPKVPAAQEVKGGVVNTSYKTFTEKKDVIITRQVAVKAAAELCKAKPEFLKEGTVNFFEMAEGIAEWILKQPKEV